MPVKKKTIKKGIVKKVKKDNCGCNCNNVNKKLQELKVCLLLMTALVQGCIKEKMEVI